MARVDYGRAVSFLTDAPWLYANGQAYARLAPESAQGSVAKVAGAATTAAFVGAGIAIYLDHPWTKPLSRALGYKNGREFMFSFPVPKGRDLPDAVAAAAFATYPLWLWLGWDRGRRRR
jgi:hypothetical protein